MMRYFNIFAGLLALTLAVPALADGVVVLDPQAAIMGTTAAKKATEKLQGDLKVQRDRMEQLKTEIEALDAKAKKDGAVMSQKDKQDLQRQAESKIQEYNNLGQTVQKRTQEALGELVQRMGPKLESVLEEMVKTNKYSVILQKQAAVYVDPAVDITKKVTEKLNAAK